MKTLFFIFSCALYLQASAINLDDILQELKSKHPMAQSIKAYQETFDAQNRALTSRKALKFSAQGAYANPKLEASGYEYSLGLQQNFMHPGLKENALQSAHYQSDAKILTLKYNFLLLKNRVRLHYHLNCLDQKAIKQYKTSYEAFQSLYIKKEKAFSYGEISKKELLQLQIELDRLKNEYKHYKNEEKISRNNLQSIMLLADFEKHTLSCEDTYVIKEKLTLESSDIRLQEQSLNKKIQSLESTFNQFDTHFNSYTVSASYEEELDTDRFMLGISVPLNFTTEKNEDKRAAALHEKSALEYERQSLKLQKESDIKLLNRRLEQAFQDIKVLTSILKKYEDELMPLVERGYHLGEDSAIEYLLAKREIWEFKEELIEHYKNYYEVLFELYSALEIKD